jgi:tetratricopeptide (TPR) repeat protein
MIKKLFYLTILVGFITSAKAQTLKEAIKLSENEQYDDATRVLKELIAGAYKNGEYYYFLGENYFNQGILDSANRYFEKGIDVDPNNPLNYVGLGKMEWYDARFNGAKAHFDKALTMSEKRNVRVLTQIAKVYTQADKKELDAAQKLLEDAKKIENKNTEIPLLMGDVALENGDGSKAVEYYKVAQELDKKSSLATLRIGQLYGRARNYSLAFEYYQNAANIDSSFAPAYREQAELYYRAGQFERAKQKYRKFLELSSNNSEARRRYASFLFLNKDYDEAINQLQMVRKVDTSFNVVNRLLAFSYFETAKYPEALNFSNLFFLRQTVEKNKLLADDFAYKGKILSKLGQDTLGVVSLERAVKMDTSKSELYGEIANIYLKMKKNPEAIKYFEQKIKSKRQLASTDYYNIGKAYYFNKEYTKADTSFGTFIALQPKLFNGYLWKARTKSAMDPDNKLGLAKPFFEKYIERVVDREKEKRDLIDAYLYLGSYYYAAKDNANSKMCYQKVLELEPKNEKATKNLSLIK